MKKKELQIILEAQLPKSYHSDANEVKERQQESSTAAAQHSKQPETTITQTYTALTIPKRQQTSPEPSNPAPQPGTPPPPILPPSPTSSPAPHAHPNLPGPTPHRSTCASPSYHALFTPWPFSAPSRGQTAMPGVVARLIDNLPTREERSVARRLWNRSLPVAANVGVIEFNRVEAGMFGERVAERYGEEWAGRVEGLKGRLNGGAGVVGGKGEGKGGEGGGVGGKEDLGKGDMKWVEVPEGTGKESETRTPNEIGAKATKPETRILDHVAEAAALVVKIEKEPETEAAESTIVRDKEAHEKPDDEATEAAVSLVSLSDTPTNNPTNDPESLAASNALSALWYLIDRFFSSGHEAASYFFVALEAAIRLEQTTVHALNIPAPPAFWTDAADWKVPKVGMALVLTLASSENNMFDAFARFSKSLGKPALSVEEMRKKNSASLRKAVLRAKDDALNKKRTTILGVDLRDLRYSQLCEQQGKGVEKHFATFARRFVLGVCPEGAKLWLVGGEWGETTTVWESNNKVGAAVGTWEEMDEFVRAFEGFAVPNGKWTSKRFKWFRRCFAVDLKQFDLQIDDEEKKKRGMQKKDEGVKRLLIDIEAWVDIYKIEDVKREDVGKFSWL